MKGVFKRFMNSRYQLVAQAVEYGTDGEYSPPVWEYIGLPKPYHTKVNLNSELLQALVIKRSTN